MESMLRPGSARMTFGGSWNSGMWPSSNETQVTPSGSIP